MDRDRHRYPPARAAARHRGGPLKTPATVPPHTSDPADGCGGIELVTAGPYRRLAVAGQPVARIGARQKRNRALRFPPADPARRPGRRRMHEVSRTRASPDRH
jgi:hypothetical protein